MSAFPIHDILTLIPQKPPFVMVDQLLYADDITVKTSFTVTPSHLFTVNGVYTEPGLIENMAQTAAAGAGFRGSLNKEPVLVGYIGAIRNLHISALPNIGDELSTEVRVAEQLFNMTVVHAEIRCNEMLLAKCEMRIFLEAAGQ
jgi:predicted hotdog family 3-hydroxylacyl-ACP dehydratase